MVNTVGLAPDFFGVVLLFRFGLPPDVRRSGADLFTWGVDEVSLRFRGSPKHAAHTLVR